MKVTNYLLPTLKEEPSDAEVISHKLMIRAGMIRKLASGIYTYLPLGLRIIKKISAIISEEMERAGAMEVLMPSVQPKELWEESGRWSFYGKELLRFKDRMGREFCYGPTHEEVITDLVRNQIKSYRELPVNLFQIQTKFRDEIRPRFGIMRSREFIMKDGYSFDIDEPSAEKAYEKMYAAYTRIFRRCGLDFRAVEADTGTIGGSFSHEFMVMAESGEDLIYLCDACHYAANREKTEVNVSTFSNNKAEPQLPIEKVLTTGKKSIEDVSAFLKLPQTKLMKALIYLVDSVSVMALVRGDRDVNEIKLRNILGAAEIRLATDTEISEDLKLPVGYLGPRNTAPLKIVADISLKNCSNFVIGANETDYHLVNVNFDRDIQIADFFDISEPKTGDRCPRCGKGGLYTKRGIEVGHIFKLGTKYSEALKATYLDENGQERLIVMGCYGIGVGRTAAASIEQNNDKDGIIFPVPIAPFHVSIVPTNTSDEDILAAADQLYEKLEKAGVEVLLDDRDERAGVKFKDADLIGIPYRINVGKTFKTGGKVELVSRKTKETAILSIDEVVLDVTGRIATALKEHRI